MPSKKKRTKQELLESPVAYISKVWKDGSLEVSIDSEAMNAQQQETEKFAKKVMQILKTRGIQGLFEEAEKESKK